MKYYTTITLALLACLSSSGLAARSDETTQTTTTITTGPTAAALSLPLTGTYVVVDPITGQIQGNYDPRARLVDGGALRTGLVIVNETNGGPLGFVDASGNIVDLSTSP